MRNRLVPALLAALLAIPTAAFAQSAGSLLDEARVSLEAMQQAVQEVGRLADSTRQTDRVKYNCVNESYQAMQKSTQRAGDTIDAAAGWGLDVAAAALKAVQGAKNEVQQMRAEANRCVGIEDGAQLASDHPEPADEGANDGAQYAANANGSDESQDEDAFGWFDPFASAGVPTAGSIALRGRPPAASPTK